MDEEARPVDDQPVESGQPDASEDAGAVLEPESASAEVDLALSEDPFAEPSAEAEPESETEVPTEPDDATAPAESGEAGEAAQAPEAGEADTLPEPTDVAVTAAPEASELATVTEAEAPEVTLDEMVASLRDGEGPAETAEDAEPGTGAEESGELAEAEGAASTAEEAAPAAAAGAVVLPVEDDGSACARRSRSARVPFYVYLGVWLVFSGVTVYLLWSVGSGSFVGHPAYGLLVLVGVALLCLGPLVALGSWWYASAHSEPDERVGLVRAVLLRSAATMAGGVVLWWVALVVLDLHRTGLLG